MNVILDDGAAVQVESCMGNDEVCARKKVIIISMDSNARADTCPRACLWWFPPPTVGAWI